MNIRGALLRRASRRPWSSIGSARRADVRGIARRFAAGCFVSCAASLAFVAPAWGQTIYKCMSEGRTVYRHEPCTNPHETDATPARGINDPAALNRPAQQSPPRGFVPPDHRTMRSEPSRRPSGRERRAEAVQEKCRALVEAMPQATDSAELLRLRNLYARLDCR